MKLALVQLCAEDPEYCEVTAFASAEQAGEHLRTALASELTATGLLSPPRALTAEDAALIDEVVEAVQGKGWCVKNGYAYYLTPLQG